MVPKASIIKYLPWALLLVTINSHGLHSLQLGNTFFWWVIQFIVLFLFWVIKNNYTTKYQLKSLFLIRLYLFYILVCFIRGLFIATTYWDWKGLVNNTMCLLIPIVAFSINSKYLFQYLIKHFIYYALPLFLAFQFFIGKDEYGFYLAPFSFLLLFFPLLQNKWKVLILLIALYVIFSDFGARSNVIKFCVPLLMSLLIYFRKVIGVKIIEFSRLLLFSLPFVFFYLGVFKDFNIFNPNGDKHKPLITNKRDVNGNLIQEDLTADTRTFLYKEVLYTATKYNSWLFGRSPARGNISDSFGYLDMNRRNERLGNEVSILNYFTWTGLIGVFLIFTIYFRASYLAINCSNNIISKIVGLFIAFRWAYSWVEDINNFYIQYIYLWFFIGFCFSESFRRMNNKEIKEWVLGIFSINKLKQSQDNIKVQLD